MLPAVDVARKTQAEWVHPGNWLAWLAAAMASGLALAPDWRLALLYLALVAVFAWRRWQQRAGLGWLFAALGVLVGQIPHPAPLLLPTGQQALDAWLTAPARPNSRGGSNGILQTHDGHRLLATFPLPPDAVPAGHALQLHGNVDSLSGWMQPSYRRYLHQQNVHQQFTVHQLTLITPATGVRPALARVRHQAGHVLDSALHGGARSGLARALLLGDRSLMASDTRSTFQITGTMHLVAVSGSHLSLLLILLWAVLRPAGLHLYHHRVWQAPLLTLLLTTYALLTGWEAPVVRAVFMAALLLLGRALHRHPTGWNLWGISLLLHLVMVPSAIHDAAFQLSYSAVAGLLFGVPRVQAAVAPRWHWLVLPLATTAIATLAIMPLQLLLFGQLPVYTLVANALLTPLAALSLALGLLLLALHGVPLLGFALAAWTASLLDAQLWLAAWISRWPGAAWPITPTPIVLATVVAGLIALVLYARHRWPAARRPLLWV